MEKNNAQDSEFSLSAVPESERKSYFSLTIVWTGFVFVITRIMAILRNGQWDFLIKSGQIYESYWR